MSSVVDYPLPQPAMISSPFNDPRRPYKHRGVDLVAPTGTLVLSSIEGQVTTAGWYGSYGKTVVIKSSNRKVLYAHLSEVLVKIGQSVRKGEPVGKVGSTGRSTGPHLHWEKKIKQNGRWFFVDPMKQLEESNSAVR
ncbi:M23 family metallopeptidase [Leptolyngbya sp. AN03gr2]|uniref:M23 family metallopeptidase n=1 Tax=Leptolyngbya sp. AN03gr2 TaxID=3423364 RepID=UPI003D316F35